MTLGLKFLLGLNEKFFDSKKLESDIAGFQLEQMHYCETVGKGVSITSLAIGRCFSAYTIIQSCKFRTFSTALLALRRFLLMKLDLSAGTLCQIQLHDTLGVSDMLRDYLCSNQTKLEVLFKKEIKVLQNNYR